MSGVAGPRLTVVLRRADDARAEVDVIVGLPEAAVSAGTGPVAISGTLTGPQRGRDVTLPVTARLAPPTPSAIASLPPAAAVGRVLLTEPAYWTPALPNLYRLRASIRPPDREPTPIDRLVGLRRLGVRGRSLWLEGRRWVPRGVAVAAGGFAPGLLRGLAAAAVIDDPPPAVCAAADAAGVAIVAGLPVPGDAATFPAAARARLAEWSLHPAVVAVVLPRGLPAAEATVVAADLARPPGAPLVAVAVDGTLPPPDAAGGGDCLVVELAANGLPHEEWRGWRGPLPLLARRCAAPTDVAAARRACDRLQADLAAWGVAGADGAPLRDWAGYLVG